MSAFVVSKDQISVLVAAGVRLLDQEVSTAHASAVGQALLDECVRSVSYRYPDDDLGELPGSYQEETFAEGIDPVSFAEWLTPYAYAEPDQPTQELVSEEIGCYEYQSCEHPEWEDSWAHDYCLALRAQLARLPKRVLTPAAPEPDPEQFQCDYGDLSRDQTIKRIRAALKRRSGKSWSVTGGRGTAWGWIHIQSPPKRRTGKHVQIEGALIGEYEHIDTGEPQEFGVMTPAECRELGELLGKDRPVHCQGEGIPASSDYRREYIDRAEGREPGKYGTRYWD